MLFSRRKFIKHLAFVFGAGTIAPVALAKTLAASPGPWVTYDLVAIAKNEAASALYGNEIDGLRKYEDTIIIDQRRKRRKNPIFTGKLGIYEDITIHRHR
jgi:hypothetical protein